MASITSTITCNDRMSSVLDKINDRLMLMQNNVSQTNVTINYFEAAQKKANEEVDDGTKAFEALTSKLKGYVAGFLSLRTAFSILKQGIEYASDLAEVQNVVDVTFSDAADSVSEWCQNTLTAYGLNEATAKQYVGTMGAMLKSSGVAEDSIVSLSESLTALAGDIASMYNLDADEAFGKIRSGISGETEPLKQLGINMSVANLEAYALAQGIETSYSAMSQAQQMVLRYNYLLDATSDAQTDFSRTQDSWANQTKLLQENWTALIGTASGGIISTLTPALQNLNSIITNLQQSWTQWSPLLSTIAVAIGVVAAAVAVWKLRQLELNAAMLANPVVIIIAAIVAVIGLIVLLVNYINECCGTSISVMGIIGGALSVAVTAIENIVLAVCNFVIGIIVTIQNALASIANFLSNFLVNPFGAVMTLINDIADACLSIIQTIAAALDTLFGTNWSGKIQDFRDQTNKEVADIFGTEEVVAKWNIEDYKLQGKDLLGSWDKGYSAGSSLQDALTKFDTDTDYDPSSVYTKADIDWSQLDSTDTSSDLTDNTSAIASNTAKSSDSLKWLRELAEQEHIDKYTTAEVVVNFTSNANVTSTQDADSVFGEFSEKLQEAMAKSRAGV